MRLVQDSRNFMLLCTVLIFGCRVCGECYTPVRGAGEYSYNVIFNANCNYTQTSENPFAHRFVSLYSSEMILL